MRQVSAVENAQAEGRHGWVHRVGEVSGGGMTEQEYAELWRLRMRWLGIYHVALAEGVWRAKRYHDVTHILTANTLAGLAEQIQHDYAG
jgi:hypothetical protein